MFLTAAIVAVAVLRWPYGYYTFTRFVVCGFCGSLAYLSWVEKVPAYPWAVSFGAVALLFNPLIPIHLNRATWFWFNIGTAALILAHLIFVRLAKFTK